MSSDKTPGNLNFKCGDAWSLGHSEHVQLHVRKGASILASKQDIKQTDTQQKQQAQKQKGSVQQKRGSPHIHGENTEDKKNRLHQV